jgi:hypothetical protein
VRLATFLESIGLVDLSSGSAQRGGVKTPLTLEDGTSKEFFDNYATIIDALIEASVP